MTALATHMKKAFKVLHKQLVDLLFEKRKMLFTLIRHYISNCITFALK